MGRAETPIYATTVEAVTTVMVASHPLPGGIVGAASRSRGRHLVDTNIRVLRNAERAHGTGAVLVIMTADEVIDGTDTRIAAVGEDF